MHLVVTQRMRLLFGTVAAEMSWESVGSVHTGNMPQDEDWIIFALRLAKSYTLLACGSPPSGCDLDVMWHDHELGSYPSLGLWSEFAETNHYFSQCESALDCVNESINWNRLKALYDSSVEDEISDQDTDFQAEDYP